MAIGGYKVLDLGGINLSGSAQLVEGIYGEVESSVGKPLLIRNFAVGNVERNAFFAVPHSESAGAGLTRYVIPLFFTEQGFQGISITSNDMIATIGKNFN